MCLVFYCVNAVWEIDYSPSNHLSLGTGMGLVGGRVYWGEYDSTLAGDLDASEPGLDIVPSRGNWKWWFIVTMRGKSIGIGIPIWAPWLFCMGIVLFPRYRKPRSVNCRKCGYDSRGNTTSVCPECGAYTNKDKD